MPNNYTTIAICDPGYDFDVAAFNKQHGKTCLCSVVKPMPKAIADVPATTYPDGTTEKQRRGVNQDWYDWAIENWGTKWGTYDVEAFALEGDSSPVLIKFQSAWSPPKLLEQIGQWLNRVCNFKRVSFIGFDPYDDSLSILHHDHIVKHEAAVLPPAAETVGKEVAT